MTKLDQGRLGQRAQRAQVPVTRRRPPLTGGAAVKKFGYCPDCGSAQWWDNTSRKVLGGMKKTAPDAKCSTCGYTIWPSKK